MKLHRYTSLMLLFLLFSLYGFAQTGNNDLTDQQNFMTANGKIFVVMGVVLVIVLGLFIYLFNLDKKITKLEKTGKE